jgi:hypothetical protein
MNKWFKIGTVATVLAVIALMSLGTAAFAQGPATTPPALGLGFRMGPSGIGGPQNSLVAIAAKVLGIDQSTLVAELNTGKTIADVANEKGVVLDTIVDAYVAPRTTALQTAIDTKRITQAQADAALATMKSQVTAQLSAKFTPRGNGLGFTDANDDGVCDYCGANGAQAAGPRSRWSR